MWVCDITYIPLAAGTAKERFGYLAMVMDLYSRRIVSWEFARSLTDDIVMAAIRRTIAARQPPAGLVYHSDRGGQYASRVYRAVLRRAGMQQSMSEKMPSFALRCISMRRKSVMEVSVPSVGIEPTTY